MFQCREKLAECAWSIRCEVRSVPGLSGGATFGIPGDWLLPWSVELTAKNRSAFRCQTLVPSLP